MTDQACELDLQDFAKSVIPLKAQFSSYLVTDAGQPWSEAYIEVQWTSEVLGDGMTRVKVPDTKDSGTDDREGSSGPYAGPRRRRRTRG